MSQVPYRPDDQLQEEAEAFLKRYHASGSLPVPIDAIVEFGLDLEIAPILGLMRNFGMDGWLSSDLKTITVDQEIMESCENRYRFTLAHEVGHLMLHANFIRSRGLSNIQAWRTAMAAIPQSIYKRLELQANSFAGFVLVPKNELEARYLALRAWGTQSEVITELASNFEVSTQVIEIRMKKLVLARE